MISLTVAAGAMCFPEALAPRPKLEPAAVLGTTDFPAAGFAAVFLGAAALMEGDFFAAGLELDFFVVVAISKLYQVCSSSQGTVGTVAQGKGNTLPPAAG